MNTGTSEYSGLGGDGLYLPEISVVVLFALMPYRQNSDAFFVVDFEQGDVAARAKRDDHLEGIAQVKNK